MAEITRILQTRTFQKAVKKLHSNQKADLDGAIRVLMANPEEGEKKKGDLAFLRVYKFSMAGQRTLLGYHYAADLIMLELLALGTHENFYRNLKRTV